jgi:hypothetical protein
MESGCFIENFNKNLIVVLLLKRKVELNDAFGQFDKKGVEQYN